MKSRDFCLLSTSFVDFPDRTPAMSLTISQRLDGLKVRTAELVHWRDRQSRIIDGWTFDGEPIALHQDWPHRRGTVHFSASTTAPHDWPLDQIRLQLDLGPSNPNPQYSVADIAAGHRSVTAKVRLRPQKKGGCGHHA